MDPTIPLPAGRTRLVASDLDGTLLLPDGTVGPRTRHALDALRGSRVTMAIVTGRPPRWISPVVEMTGHEGIGVAANGAVILDLADGRVTGVAALDPAQALEAVHRLRSAIPGVVFAVEFARVGDRMPHADSAADVEPRNFALGIGYRPRWPVQPGTLVAPVEELIATGDVVKLLARPSAAHDFDADSFLAAGHVAVQGLVQATHSNVDDVLLEMSALGVTKGRAVAALAESLGAAQSEVVAVGDAPNDIPMIEWAGMGYAVANAHPDVLDLADAVIPPNSDEGVAYLLEAVLSQQG